MFNEPDKKGMISNIYSTLISAVQESPSLPCRCGWEEDLGDISGEKREVCLQSIPVISVSPSDKLSHLFLLHTAYHTTIQLHHWGRRDSPICPKCCREEGSLIHLMWHYPKLFRYWNYVTEAIATVYKVKVPLDPIICLLGAVDEEIYIPPVNIAVLRLLYIARKQVARFWLSLHTPHKKTMSRTHGQLYSYKGTANLSA